MTKKKLRENSIRKTIRGKMIRNEREKLISVNRKAKFTSKKT